MITCIYDNPKTLQREYWVDGELKAFTSALRIVATNHHPSQPSFFTAPFQSGAIEGDRRAINE